jgi:hypothetical protein
MIILYILAAIWIISVIVNAILISRAPQGYEDQNGFHLGERQ